MISYLNTNSGIEVEERIENGDEEAPYIRKQWPTK